MADRKHGRRLTRDYRSFSTTPWEIWDTIGARKSVRRYEDSGPSEQFVKRLNEVVVRAMKVRGVDAGSIVNIADRSRGETIRKSAYKGATGKINLWLANSSIYTFLVAVIPAEELHAERPRLLPKVSMALEDCVLWLTSQGFGTCWLGGVNLDAIREATQIGVENVAPVIISYGLPRGTGGISYDSMAAQAMSKRRRQLSRVASVDTVSNSYELPSRSFDTFSAAGVQDIYGLLQAMETGSTAGEYPVDLAVEACLESARIAPNASNIQNWQFTAVISDSRLSRIADACGSRSQWTAAIVGSAPAASNLSHVFGRPFWMIDVPIALSHVSLMAASMGAGVEVYTEFDERAVNDEIGAARGLRAAGVVGLV